MATTSTDPSFHGASHAHEQCVSGALAEVEALCRSQGLRLTETRRQVLELVWASHKAVKAYDLMEQLSEDGRHVKPPTVYRALDFLIAHGFVHRVDSLNAFVGCPHPGAAHSAQFLICDGCGEVSEMAAPSIDSAVARKAETAGFAISHQIIELHGSCPACQAN